MTPAEAIQAELTARMRRLLRVAMVRDVREDLAAIAGDVAGLMANGTLYPGDAVDLLRMALLFRDVGLVRQALAYLRRTTREHGMLNQLEGYLAAPCPSEHDLLRAEYALKAHAYDALFEHTHALLREALDRLARRVRFDRFGTMADLGCGTGVVGQWLRANGFGGALVGVDLSPEMLERATAAGGYTRLVCRDLGAFLEAEPACFEAMIAMQVVALFDAALFEAFLVGCRSRLERGGRLLFNSPVTEIPDAPVADADSGVAALRLSRLGPGAVEAGLRRHGFAFRFFDHRDDRRYYSATAL